MDIIRAIEQQQIKSDLPEFHVGDNVKVHYRITEGNRERIQVFQGDVIRRHGHGVRETFTVRKISFSIGVERTFPVHSPKIDKIEVTRKGDVRRAKLYYLRQGWQGRQDQGEVLPLSRYSAYATSRTPHPNGGGVLFDSEHVCIYLLSDLALSAGTKRSERLSFHFCVALRWLERSQMASRGYRLRSCLGLR